MHVLLTILFLPGMPSFAELAVLALCLSAAFATLPEQRPDFISASHDEGKAPPQEPPTRAQQRRPTVRANALHSDQGREGGNTPSTPTPVPALTSSASPGKGSVRLQDICGSLDGVTAALVEQVDPQAQLVSGSLWFLFSPFAHLRPGRAWVLRLGLC